MFIKNQSTKNFNVKLLYKNNIVDNVYEACSFCYNNTQYINYLEKKEYIGKRINAGHESILEHGKLSILFTDIPKLLNESIIEVMGLDYSKWLEFYTVILENGNTNLIVNGSIRAYKFFINNLKEDEYDRNSIIKSICKIIKENTVKEFYGENKYILFDDFVDVEPDVVDIDIPDTGIKYSTIIDKSIPGIITNSNPKTKRITVGLDTVDENLINTIIKAGFNVNVIKNILPVAIVFYNMSRTATHQLVRHRNAITQESQRYVSSKNASFTIPVPEYSDDKEYTIDIFGKKVTVPLTVLATGLTKIYDQLINQGLKKEEARAFLPSNINCNRLYMTFTLSSLDAFLKLRTDPHAQYEIRKYAETIQDIIKDRPSINIENESIIY